MPDILPEDLNEALGFVQKSLQNIQDICCLATPEQAALASILVLGPAAARPEDDGIIMLDLPNRMEQPYMPEKPHAFYMTVEGSAAIMDRLLPQKSSVAARKIPKYARHFQALLQNIKDACTLDTNAQAMLSAILVTGFCTRHTDEDGRFPLMLLDEDNFIYNKRPKAGVPSYFQPAGASLIVRRLLKV